MYLDERDCSVRVVDGLYHGLWRHKVCDALRSGQVVLSGGCCGYLLVFKSVQQILTAVLLVAVLHNGPQRLSPWHLRKYRYKLVCAIILKMVYMNYQPKILYARDLMRWMMQKGIKELCYRIGRVIQFEKYPYSLFTESRMRRLIPLPICAVNIHLEPGDG